MRVVNAFLRGVRVFRSPELKTRRSRADGGDFCGGFLRTRAPAEAKRQRAGESGDD